MSLPHPLSAADALSRLYLAQPPALVAQTSRVSAGAYRLRLDAVDHHATLDVTLPHEAGATDAELDALDRLHGFTPTAPIIACTDDCACELCAAHDAEAARVRAEVAAEMGRARVAQTACLAVQRGTLDAETLAAVVVDVERAVPRPTKHDALQTLLVRMVRALGDGQHGLVGDALDAWSRAECTLCGVAALDGDAAGDCASCREVRS